MKPPNIPIDGNYNAKTAKINNSFSWILDVASIKVGSQFSFANIKMEDKQDLLEENLIDGDAYQFVILYIFKELSQVNDLDGVVKTLCRHGMYILQNDTVVSAESLSAKPLKTEVHLTLIDMLMTAACSFVWMPIGNVVSKVKNIYKFSPSQDLPNNVDDAIVLWMKKVILSIKEKEKHNSDIFFPQITNKLDDICDSAVLSLLLHYYFPQNFLLKDISLNENNSIADSLHDLTIALNFCNTSVLIIPTSLTPQDFINCSEELKINFTTFFSCLFFSLEMERKLVPQKDDLNQSTDITTQPSLSSNQLEPSTSKTVFPQQKKPVLPTHSVTSSNNVENLASYDVTKNNNQPLLPRRPQQQKPGSRHKKRFVDNSLRKSISLDDITNQQLNDELHHNNNQQGDFVNFYQSKSAEKKLPSHKFWQRTEVQQTGLLGNVDVSSDPEIEEILSTRTNSTERSLQNDLDWNGFVTRPQKTNQSQSTMSTNAFNHEDLILETYRTIPSAQTTFRAQPLDLMNSGSSEFTEVTFASSEVMNSDVIKSGVTNLETLRSGVMNSDFRRSEVTDYGTARSRVMNSDFTRSGVMNSDTARSRVTSDLAKSEVTNSDIYSSKTATLSAQSAEFSPEKHNFKPSINSSQLSYVVNNGMSEHGAIARGYPVINKQSYNNPALLKVENHPQRSHQTSSSSSSVDSRYSGASTSRNYNNNKKFTTWKAINHLVQNKSTQTNNTKQGFHEINQPNTRCQHIWEANNVNNNNSIPHTFARELELLISKYFPTGQTDPKVQEFHDAILHSETLSINKNQNILQTQYQAEEIRDLVLNSETLKINEAPTSGESNESRSRRNLFPNNQNQTVNIEEDPQPPILNEESICYSKFQDNLKVASCQSTPAKSPQPGPSNEQLEVTLVNAHNRSGLGYEISENTDNDQKKTQEKKKEQFLMSRLKKEEQTREQQFLRQKEKEEKQIKQRQIQEKIWQKREEEKERREKRLREYKEKKAQERNNQGINFLNSKEKVKKPSSSRKKKEIVDPMLEFLNEPIQPQATTSRPSTPNLHQILPNVTYISPAPSRPRGPPSQVRSSDTESTSSVGSHGEYTGPKLFKELIVKSNKSLIQNALSHCCLSGKVNEVTRNKVIEVLQDSEFKHFMILFRDDKCQYRGVYIFIPKIEKLSRLAGSGPAHVKPGMVDKLFKYNSGQRSFSPTASKTLSVAIHAFTIHSSLWSNVGKPKK